MPEGGTALLEQIERTLGGKVRVLHRLNGDAAVPELPAGDLHAVEQQIARAAASRVLLLADASGARVCPYR